MSGLAFYDWLQKITDEYYALSDQQRNVALETLISVSGSSQLLMLTSRLPEYVFRDFIRDLPLEISLHILQYLDGNQLCRCCQVSKAWNERICGLPRLWMTLAKDMGVDIDFHLSHQSQVVDTEFNKIQSSWEGLELSSNKGKEPGRQFKSLYLQSVRVLKGFKTGSSVVLHNSFIEKDTFRITSVRFFKGNIVTGCDDHTVQVWSVPDGRMLHCVATNSVCCLTVTDSRLYTASFNANAESWDLINGRHLRTFTSHTSAVLAIDVTPDERFLLTGSVDKSAKLWDLTAQTHSLLKTFDMVHDDWVFHVKFLRNEGSHLMMVTCDANMICLWKTDVRGHVLSFVHISVEGSAKFTSFYHHPNDPFHIFTCHWTEWTKSSSFYEYRIQPKSFTIDQLKGFPIALEGTKAFLLGAGHKFAVIMCSISRKDFFVLDICKEAVVATISTPYFYILTRNGSTVTLCDTQWLDGFRFSLMQKNTPVFAAWIAVDRVMLGTWAESISDIG